MAEESSKTTIQVSRETKRLIDSLKIIPAESNDSVLKRIILEVVDHETEDPEE